MNVPAARDVVKSIVVPACCALPEYGKGTTKCRLRHCPGPALTRLLAGGADGIGDGRTRRLVRAAFDLGEMVLKIVLEPKGESIRLLLDAPADLADAQEIDVRDFRGVRLQA